MSYILDALKKSEKKRQPDVVPDLHTYQDVVIYGSTKRSVWPYLILVALLLNAGLLVWWLVPWNSENAGVIARPTDRDNIETKSMESVLEIHDVKLPVMSSPVQNPSEVESTTPAEQGKKPVTKPEVIATAPVVENGRTTKQSAPLEDIADKGNEVLTVPEPEAKSTEMFETQSASPENAPVISNVPSKPQPVTNTKIVSKQRVFSLDELPLSVQKGLPDFSISAHLYSSKPTSRMVRINGRMMREGQDLIEGIMLEQITSDGVILSYLDYRFRVNLY
jgi:general secretion pathway protein B